MNTIRINFLLNKLIDMRIYMWRKSLKQIVLIIIILLIVYFISTGLFEVRQLETIIPSIGFLAANRTQSSYCSSCVTVNNNTGTLMRDGKVFRFIAGQMEYYRIPLEYWEDRIMKAKAAGLDAIAFYIPWNYHERTMGTFDFSGNRNITHYVRLIQKHGMLAMARIGPYICAEWTLGGLPPWLWHRSPNVRMRSSEDGFFHPVLRWFSELLPVLKPLLQENGGPIFMVQIENEYGEREQCDEIYMYMLYKSVRHILGNHVIYLTVDMPKFTNFLCNKLLPYDLIQTTDFKPCYGCETEHFELLKHFRSNGPLINTEYYTGWFDVWGGIHHTTSPSLFIESLWRQINYSETVSISLYMFHGGTNFGLWNGAHSSPFRTQITSYDYDAPLSEAGDITEKYKLLREALYKFKGHKPTPLPTNTNKIKYPDVKMHLVSHLLNLLTDGVKSNLPVLMEDLQQYEGFLVYVTKLPGLWDKSERLSLNYFADTIHVFTSDEHKTAFYHGTWSRDEQELEIFLTDVEPNATLMLMVENCGYKNYGNDMFSDRKGIKPPVNISNYPLHKWYMFPLCFNKDGLHCPGPFVLDVLKKRMYPSKNSLQNMPAVGRIYQGFLYINKPNDLADTFIQPHSFGRGLIYINSILLGRYDQAKGPQRNLFVPKPFLKLGENRIIIVDLTDTEKNPTIVFNKHPIWVY